MMTPEKANQRAFMDDFQQRMEEYGSSAMELHAIMANMESTVKEVVQAIPVAIEAEYKGVTDLAGDVKEARKRELGLVYMVDDDLHDLKEVAAKAERVKANAAIIECVFTAMEMTDKSNRLTIKGTEEFHKAIAAGSGVIEGARRALGDEKMRETLSCLDEHSKEGARATASSKVMTRLSKETMKKAAKVAASLEVLETEADGALYPPKMAPAMADFIEMAREMGVAVTDMTSEAAMSVVADVQQQLEECDGWVEARLPAIDELFDNVELGRIRVNIPDSARPWQTVKTPDTLAGMAMEIETCKERSVKSGVAYTVLAMAFEVIRRDNSELRATIGRMEKCYEDNMASDSEAVILLLTMVMDERAKNAKFEDTMNRVVRAILGRTERYRKVRELIDTTAGRDKFDECNKGVVMELVNLDFDDILKELESCTAGQSCYGDLYSMYGGKQVVMGRTVESGYGSKLWESRFLREFYKEYVSDKRKARRAVMKEERDDRMDGGYCQYRAPIIHSNETSEFGSDSESDGDSDSDDDDDDGAANAGGVQNDGQKKQGKKSCDKPAANNGIGRKNENNERNVNKALGKLSPKKHSNDNDNNNGEEWPIVGNNGRGNGTRGMQRGTRFLNHRGRGGRGKFLPFGQQIRPAPWQGRGRGRGVVRGLGVRGTRRGQWSPMRAVRVETRNESPASPQTPRPAPAPKPTPAKKKVESHELNAEAMAKARRRLNFDTPTGRNSTAVKSVNTAIPKEEEEEKELGQWRTVMGEWAKRKCDESKREHKKCDCHECKAACSVFLPPRSEWQASFAQQQEIGVNDYMGYSTFPKPLKMTAEEKSYWKSLYEDKDPDKDRFDFSMKLANDMLVYLVCKAKPGKTIKVLNEYVGDFFSDAAARSNNVRWKETPDDGMTKEERGAFHRIVFCDEERVRAIVKGIYNGYEVKPVKKGECGEEVYKQQLIFMVCVDQIMRFVTRMQMVANEKLARENEDKGAFGICSITMDPATADKEEDEDKEADVPDSWEERVDEEWIEDEKEIKELEEKILRKEIQGSIIKVVSSSEEGQTKINATYMPNLAVVNPFTGCVHPDQADQMADAIAGQIADQIANQIADQFTFTGEVDDDDDQTSVIDCHDDDDDQTSVIDCHEENDDELVDVDVCMIEADESDGDDDESIPSLEEMFLENKKPSNTDGGDENDGNVEKIYTSVAKLTLEGRSEDEKDGSARARGEGPPNLRWEEEYPGGVRPKTKVQKDVKSERLEQELRAAQALIGRQRIDNLRLKEEIERRRGSAFGPAWKLEEEVEAGVDKKDMENNQTLKAEMQSDMGRKAMVKTDYRKKDETFLQAAKRLGAEGIFERRREIIWKMARKWNEAREIKDVGIIKEEVKEEATKRREYFEKRAKNIQKTCDDKYLPPDWRNQSDGEEEEEEQHQAETRVELARDGLFGDVVSFDPVMG